MNFERIKYTGRKVYRDKLGGNTWQPDDTKLVTPAVAKKLLRFAEFEPAEAIKEGEASKVSDPNLHPQVPVTVDPALEQAQLLQQEQDRLKEEERARLESMLLTIESMDKDALKEYAAKYEVTLNKQKGVATLRSEVATLIEQFGVR